MIATRLSSVGQVAGVAVAALLCYLVSQSVAAERAALTKVDRQIAGEQDAIAKLGTEIATRSRLTQIENWNRQLALQAPRPGQFVDNGIQLASLYAHDAKPQIRLDPAIARPRGPIEQVNLPAITPTPTPSLAAPLVAPTPVRAAAPLVAPRSRPATIAPMPVIHAAPAHPAIEMAAFRPGATVKAKTRPEAKPDAALQADRVEPLLRVASFVRPGANRLDAVAATPTALHRGGGLLSPDILGLAQQEQARRRPRDTGK